MGTNRRGRVFLIYPPISRQERYSSDIGNSGGSQIPLGIYALAAYLRVRDFEVSAVDAETTQLTPEIIIAKIKEFKPDLIGISSTTVAFHRSLDLAQVMKSEIKDVPIVIGGPHVSSNYEHAMSYDVFDYGVVGEGEVTLWELSMAIIHRTSTKEIAGLVRREEDGLPVYNGKRSYIKDLDSLPYPAIDLVEDLSLYTPPPMNYKKLPVINIISSRGCPSECTFCDNNTFGTSFRPRSAENIAKEITWLCRDYGVREVAFVDDTFTISKQRIYDLFRLLRTQGVEICWTCMSRINTVDKDLLEFMRDHGCWHISFGIESGNQQILEQIKKRITLERVKEVVGWCAALGIKTKGFFIVGHPRETLETIDQSIAFALDLPLDDVVVTINTPIPGSPQFAQADHFGTLDKTDWSSFNLWRPVFVPHGLSSTVLLEKQKEFYRKFYFRPRIIYRYAKSFFSTSGPRRLAAMLKTLPYLLKK